MNNPVNEAEMKRAAAELRFEEAQVCKNRIESLKKHYSHSIISSVADTSCDVFSLVFDGQEGSFQETSCVFVADLSSSR